MRWTTVLGVVVLVGVLACGKAPEPDAAPTRVAAAADLIHAFEEIGGAFERASGDPVAFSFGSTGLLAKQIEGGAPFDVFAAADVSFVDEVVRAGACDEETRTLYARGRLAIWVRGTTVTPPTSLRDLTDPRFQRIAIANPEHAPYGLAARQALEDIGAWHSVEPRLVYGENVRQALQFAETGNVDAAIVALSLVVHDQDHPWVLVDQSHHRTIDQALVVCGGGANRAGGEAFVRFLGSEPGRAITRRHGFVLPDESAERDP